MTLCVRGNFPHTVFDLLGRDENSATFALGWCLEHCPTFTQRFVQKLAGRPLKIATADIRLQAHAEDGGYTDIELRCGDSFEAIVEAKVGWEVPTSRQLARYRPRLTPNFPGRQMLVSLSAANREVAKLDLPATVRGAQLEHMSFGSVRHLAKLARVVATSPSERLWLDQLIQHMEVYAAMSRVSSNLVYVVSLGSKPMRKGGDRTWIDVVEQDGRYFHPIGKHWLKEPPNYIGFRYAGRVQSVHRVTGFQIVQNVADIDPTWCDTVGPHFLYTLGPAMRPGAELRAGGPKDKIKRSARVWCAIDTLLDGQYKQLHQARDETSRRIKAADMGAA